MPRHYQLDVVLETVDAQRPRLVVSVPPEQAESVRESLAKLASAHSIGASAQEVILNALRAAAEQAYFWTAEWQEKERAAALAVAEGRVRTFDGVDDMIAFLDLQ